MARVFPSDILQRVFDQTNNVIRTDATIVGGDIQIGAVELKDHDGTDRAAVTAANELSVLDSNSADIKTAVQLIDNAVSGAGFNITQLNGAATPIGAGLEATALRVTVATDSTGVLSVDDNGAALTVDGTVTANLSATDNAVLDQIELNTDPLLVVGTGTEATAQRVTIATDSTGVLSVDDNGGILTVDGTVTVGSITAGDNNIGNVDIASGTITTVSALGVSTTGPQKAEDVAHVSGDMGVYALAVRDTAPAAHSDTDGDYESLHVNDEGGLWTTPTPSASGGLTIFRSLDLDETEEEIKATAGAIYGWYMANTSTVSRFIKFYNATAANVSVGVNTPVLTFPLPGNSTDDVGANALGAHGIAFSTAISVAATNLVADSDVTAPGTNDIIINIFYK